MNIVGCFLSKSLHVIHLDVEAFKFLLVSQMKKINETPIIKCAHCALFTINYKLSMRYSWYVIWCIAGAYNYRNPALECIPSHLQCHPWLRAPSTPSDLQNFRADIVIREASFLNGCGLLRRYADPCHHRPPLCDGCRCNYLYKSQACKKNIVPKSIHAESSHPSNPKMVVCCACDHFI